MPAALKRPTLDELYKRLRDIDFTQVDKRLAVMLNAILQLEAQGECRESAFDGGLRGHDLARNPGLSSNMEYGAGEFLIRSDRQREQGLSSQVNHRRCSGCNKQKSRIRILAASIKRELERAQRERDKAILDRDQAAHERHQAKLVREQSTLELDKAILDRDLLMAERVQEQRLHERVAKRDQIKSELERLQRKQQAVASGKEKKRTTTEPAVVRSRVVHGERRSSSGGRSLQPGTCGPRTHEWRPGNMDHSRARPSLRSGL